MKKQKKTETIQIRATKKLKKYLKKHKQSPTRIFNQAMEDHGYKEL